MLSSLQLVERAEEATHAQEDDLDEPDLGRLVVIRRSGQDGGSCPVAPRLTFGRRVGDAPPPVRASAPIRRASTPPAISAGTPTSATS